MDWKGLGYAVSIVSVFVLGAVAWPKAEDPRWVMPALIVGVTTSIVGMAFRYIAHVQQRRELRQEKANTRRV